MNIENEINQLRLCHKDDLNNAVQPLLTDLYQISMAYAYWKSQRDDIAVFDMYFRKNPFNGEFTIFAGLEECLKFLRDFKFTDSDISYLKKSMPANVEDEFFNHLKNANLDNLKLYAIPEGSLVFPRVPIIRVEGPLSIVQLLETTLLVLVNYASLVATNAARFRLAAGPNKTLLEFGLRRAQGPDGGLSGSKYCYLGGFDGTSNVLAGKLFGIPIKGTHAHSYVSSYYGLEDLKIRECKSKLTGENIDIAALAETNLQDVCRHLSLNPKECNKGELAAFISYAISFPADFLALVDTYNVLQSGIPNFCAVSLALNQIGYKTIGIRLDSGDLAYLSNRVRGVFKKSVQCMQFMYIDKYLNYNESFHGYNHSRYNIEWFEKLTIVASNDINEDILYSLNSQGHSIDSFGIGTHLVTCQKQPALGCVFKLVEVNGKPCIKLSEDFQKATFPGKKNAFRLYDKDDIALVDLLTKDDEEPPKLGEPFLCRHPFIETKRAYLIPSRVELLYVIYWDKGKIVAQNLPTLQKIRERVANQLKNLRIDHKRILNPTPYKITVSEQLYNFMHKLWLEYTPIGELY